MPPVCASDMGGECLGQGGQTFTIHTPQTGSPRTHAQPQGHKSSVAGFRTHSDPFHSLSGGGAGLRTRPTVSRIRGGADPLLEACDLLANCLCVVHHSSLRQHLRVMHIEFLGTPQTGSPRTHKSHKYFYYSTGTVEIMKNQVKFKLKSHLHLCFLAGMLPNQQ